jgi:hypothetical protein
VVLAGLGRGQLGRHQEEANRNDAGQAPHVHILRYEERCRRGNVSRRDPVQRA